jgi:hypothetical protein
MPKDMKDIDIEFMTCNPTSLTFKMMPMLCFAYFFENILIPVSKAFSLKDDNGALGMKSSIISLGVSFSFYVIIMGAMTITKVTYNRMDENNPLYIAVYKDFNKGFSCAALLLMALLAQLQAQCYYQLALE